MIDIVTQVAEQLIVKMEQLSGQPNPGRHRREEDFHRYIYHALNHSHPLVWPPAVARRGRVEWLWSAVECVRPCTTEDFLRLIGFPAWEDFTEEDDARLVELNEGVDDILWSIREQWEEEQ